METGVLFECAHPMAVRVPQAPIKIKILGNVDGFDQLALLFLFCNLLYSLKCFQASQISFETGV